MAGNESYVLVANNWQYPGVNYDSLRKWVAPKDGVISISGTASVSISTIDGVIVSIRKDITPLWETTLLTSSNNSAAPSNLSINVIQGEVVYLIVNNGGNGDNINDTTFWDPIITYTN